MKDQDSTKCLRLVFAGNIMQHISQITSAEVDNGYDYTSCFRYIKSQIEYADIVVGTFETTLAGPPYTGYPRFGCPDDFLRDCKTAGFNVMLTASNHTCDRGKRGVVRTIKMMDSLKIGHLGSYVDIASRNETYPYILEKNGFRLVFLNYTYGTNNISVKAPNVVNLIDIVQIEKDIEIAQSNNPDCIIAFMHWGEEYNLMPNCEQKELAGWLFEKGVTHVIGSHPHVVQPMEIRTDQIGDKHVLVYSLGNFISNQSLPNTYGGMLVHLELEKNNTSKLKDCHYSLFFVTRPEMSGHKTHRVYNINTPESILNSAEIELRNSFLNTARPLFAKYNKNVSENYIET